MILFNTAYCFDAACTICVFYCKLQEDQIALDYFPSANQNSKLSRIVLMYSLN